MPKFFDLVQWDPKGDNSVFNKTLSKSIEILEVRGEQHSPLQQVGRRGSPDTAL